jgi:hypothetical protein
MDLNEIQLENLSKNFEYAKISMELDSIENIDELRNMTKLYAKLFIKQQEVLSNIISFDNL